MGRFIIQNNLIAENDLRQMQTACTKHGISFEDVKVIPFTKELPKFTIADDNIYYGSTTFIANVYEQLKPKGVFFDPNNFLISNYLDKWGSDMLNAGSDVCTIGEFIERGDKKYKFKDDHLLFIRPNADDKSFEGQLMTFGNIKDWKSRLTQFDNIISIADALCVFGEPYNIRKEWRTFIIDGEIVTASLYRENFKLKKSATDIPDTMLKFVKDRINEYQPARAFVMDIAITGGQYYIIECGCINSVGFYHADIEKIVVALSKAV